MTSSGKGPRTSGAPGVRGGYQTSKGPRRPGSSVRCRSPDFPLGQPHLGLSLRSGTGFFCRKNGPPITAAQAWAHVDGPEPNMSGVGLPSCPRARPMASHWYHRLQWVCDPSPTISLFGTGTSAGASSVVLRTLRAGALGTFHALAPWHPIRGWSLCSGPELLTVSWKQLRPLCAGGPRRSGGSGFPTALASLLGVQSVTQGPWLVLWIVL